MFMRLALLASLSMSAAAIAAPAKIVCGEGRTAIKATLNDLNLDAFYSECQEQFVTNRGLCYEGNRTEAIAILRAMDDNDVLGDEYRLRNVRASGQHGISYTIFDGPNQITMGAVKIGPCL